MFFQAYEKQLGYNALLGVKFYLLNPQGRILHETGYNNKLMLPMASTKKIMVAMAVLKKIFVDNDFDLNSQININDAHFSAGCPTNSLDRYFFVPYSITDTRTIDQLLTYMLTESDNSSTDILIELVGGETAINQLMLDLHIHGHQLSFSSKLLLANYFGTTTEKSFSNIFHTLYELLSAYSLRPSEASIVQSEQDACTPQMAADLLKLLVSEYTHKENWIGKAAQVIFDKMGKCLTGNTLIKAGAKDLLPYSKAFGSKQGGLGGIRNDTAFIQLYDGRWAILSIHTCLSSLPLNLRDAIIADLSNNLLNEYFELSYEAQLCPQ